MNKISIIVPTYNVEKYLAKCLDSLVAQDYDDFDVLVINDGSPFGEQKIIDEYALKYSNIIKGYKKENGGYGSVLELGIKESDADFILICDPDDYLAPNALSTLYRYLKETGADLVVGAKNLVFSDNDEVKYDKSFNSDFGTLIDHHLYEKGSKEFETLYFLEPSPHAKLYKREMVKDLVFPHHVSYTDNLLYFCTLAKTQKVTYCKEALSYYLIDRVGNTRTDLKPKVIDAWVTVFKNILNQVKEADDIFYYRMFEGFYSIFYKVEQINAEREGRIAKYNEVYELVPLFFKHKESIVKYLDANNNIYKQQINLLDETKSAKTYQKMLKAKVDGTLKGNVKKMVMENKALSKLYEHYHFYAKYLYARKKNKIDLNNDVEMLMPNDDGTNFFGYYDKPCKAYGHFVYHHLDSSSLSFDQEVKIMVDDKVVSKTRAWNFQQGAMTSWLDEKHIIHNYFDGKKYCAKKVNIDTLESETYVGPIYSLSKNKNFALSLNFSRLAKLRPDYGYFNLPYQNLKDDKEDGIFYLDLEKNEMRLLMSLEMIKNFEAKENMKGAIHKVNHIDISPNSDKAIFLHRWYLNNIKYTRLLCLNLQDLSLKVLADNDMVSHMAWVNNDLVFGYLKGQCGKDAYYYIDMNGKQTIFEHPLLIDDGHPTIVNERYIITDTYPDYTCKSKLYLIDTKTKEIITLGSFYSGMKYQGVLRCDLHPRVDDDHQGVSFDSVASGKREVYHLTLDKILKDRL